MTWIKRNLFLVIGGVIALALLGMAGYYLSSQIGRYNEVTGELAGITTDLNSLYSSTPFPNQDNISAAKAEEQRAQSLIEDVKKFFVAPPYPKQDISEFKANLENSIVHLQREATNAGVTIAQPAYKFTFAAQRPLAQFASGSLEPLTGQLEEIKQLCAILFRAKIHTLESLRRAPVSSDDPASSPDYLVNKKITTNDTANVLVSPYELNFYGFSSDLATVLDGLNRAPQFFAVKYLVVDTAPISASPASSAPTIITLGAPAAPTSESPTAPGSGMSMEMRRRYGLGGPGGGRYGPGQRGPMAEMPVPTPAPPTGPVFVTPTKALTTFLDEKLLKFTLLVDAIKVKPGK